MAITKRLLPCFVLSALLGGCGLTQPTDPLDLYLRGTLEAEKGQLPTALASLTQAIEKNPKMGLAYVARGDVYKQQGNYEKAATDFEQAVKLEPYNFNANFQLGLVYQYLKRFADAVVSYQKAVEIRPLDAEANMNLAMAYTQLGQPLRGLPYAQRAVQGNGDSPQTHANLGILYAQVGYTDAAVDSLKRSIELNSRQPEVYVNLGQEYINMGKFDQAKNVLETARSLAPSPLVSDRLGVAHYKLQNYEQANASFQDALRLDPRYYSALNGLGVVAMSRALLTTPPDVERAKEALAFWHRSLQIKPDQEVIEKLVNKYSAAQ
jgi:tetratricopeptide (TPR) repeat protein